jgi:hypothetical protein
VDKTNIIKAAMDEAWRMMVRASLTIKEDVRMVPENSRSECFSGASRNDLNEIASQSILVRNRRAYSSYIKYALMVLFVFD